MHSVKKDFFCSTDQSSFVRIMLVRCSACIAALPDAISLMMLLFLLTPSLMMIMMMMMIGPQRK